MGREVRKVKADWEHPKTSSGRYDPLFESDSYESEAEEWDAYYKENGLQKTLEDIGDPPNKKDYMPCWTDEEKTHYQMYEDCSEGTPISPVMATIEELARWLADNKASAFGSETATYEQWLATCQQGWAPSAVFSPSTGMISGVQDAIHHSKEANSAE